MSLVIQPTGDATALYRALLNYGVLIFKDLKPGVREHISLTALFGEMDEPPR